MPWHAAACGSTGSPHARQGRQQLQVLGRSAVGRADVLIDEGLEPAARDQSGVEIPHRSGRNIARIREERLVGVVPLLVDAVERRARQKHLAAHFEAPDDGPPRSAQRNRPDRAHVRGDLLAAHAVAARGAADETTPSS